MRMVVVWCALVGLLLSAPAAWAQAFGPKDYADCVMLYSKKPASQDARTIIHQACKCRFKEPTSASCRKYSPQALECLITNLIKVERDVQAWGVERACRTKHPVRP